MNNYIKSLVVLLFCCSISFGQNPELFRPNTYLDLFAHNQPEIYTPSADLDVEGSPYINADFSPIKINNHKVIFKGRFNAHTGEMEVTTEDSRKTVYLDYTRPIKVYFTSLGKTYKSYEYEDRDGNLKYGFLVEVYEDDNITLLAKEIVVFHERTESQRGIVKGRPARFKRSEDIYFIKLNDGIIKTLPRNRKELSELFPNNRDEIKDFVKIEKINTTNKDDLIKFIKYVNSLVL